MSSKIENGGLGEILYGARANLGLSLQEVAAAAGCSTAYVHKLEQGRVRSPSPRVLAGLGHTLGLEYETLMQSVGYGERVAPAASPPVSRYSNAHIVELLERLVDEVEGLRTEIVRHRSVHDAASS